MYERIIGIFLLLLSLGGYWPINYHLHCNCRDNANALSNCTLTSNLYAFSLRNYHLDRITGAGFREEDYKGKRRDKVIYHVYLKGNYDTFYFLNLYSTNYNQVSFLISQLNNYIVSGTSPDYDIPRFKNFILLELLTISLFILSLMLIILGDKFGKLLHKIV
ncbi:MAG: hypothetical protein P4L79_14135 [Legionella sp.]|nr:hypothetical protein [Legionella sp.]